MIKLIRRIPKPIIMAVAVPMAAAALEWASKKNRSRYRQGQTNALSDNLEKASRALRTLR